MGAPRKKNPVTKQPGYGKDMMRQLRASRSDLTYAPPANYARRRRLEKSLGAWLKYYMSEAFDLGWAEFHVEAIAKLQTSLMQGGSFALALPRGSGKSTICRGAAIWAILAGHRRYVLMVGATGKKAESALKDIKSVLRFTDRIAADYPEVITPIRALEGVSLRAMSQTAFGEPTMITWNAKRLSFPCTKRISAKGREFKSPSAGAIIDIDGITGDIRGHVVTLPDGHVIRPDAAICDDVQTRESASSPSQTETRLKTITDDVAGSAGPGKNLSVVAPCTVIKKGDLADRLLDKEEYPDFRGQRLGMVISWPDDMEMWEDGYAQARIKGIEDEDDGKQAAAYYAKHRKAMDRGARVSWPARVQKNETSAIQNAMNLYLKMGKSGFYAEYQNEPIVESMTLYDLTPDVIMGKTYGLPVRALPTAGKTVVAFTDINHYGLHWVIAGFRNDFAGFVPIYGKYPERGELVPKNATESERAELIRKGLDELSGLLQNMDLRYENGERVAIRVWMIDRGYMPEVVHSFCRYSKGSFPKFPARGYAGHIYTVRKSTCVGRPRENVHLVESRLGQFIAYNACYWREYAQRAWLGRVGTPGAFALFGKKGLVHREFAEQICAEKLVDKAVGDRGTIYRWAEVPARWHDFGDCMYGCCVGAAWSGLTTTGDGAPLFAGKRPRPIRRARK